MSGSRTLTPIDPPSDMRALIVFSGVAQLWWLRWLRPGFRHCFAVLSDGQIWLTYDPLSHRTEIKLHALPANFDVATWYRAFGHVVVDTRIRPTPRCPAPWNPYTCVEAIKRILGIRARFVCTPWRLYRYLTEGESSKHSYYKFFFLYFTKLSTTIVNIKTRIAPARRVAGRSSATRVPPAGRLNGVAFAPSPPAQCRSKPHRRT